MRPGARENTNEAPVHGRISMAAVMTASSAMAQTEIQWWHAMTGANNESSTNSPNDFNASQNEYKVVAELQGRLCRHAERRHRRFRAGNAPHIMQVFEVGTATMMGANGAIKPVQR